MDAIFYGIADSTALLFELMANLGNIPNMLFVICMVGAFLAWTSRLYKYNRLGENE